MVCDMGRHLVFGELLHISLPFLATVKWGEYVEELHQQLKIPTSDARHSEDGTDAEIFSDTVSDI